VLWGGLSFPVVALAAWSIAVDSVVLVQIAKWLVPEPLVFATGRPEESIDGEDTNSCIFLLVLLSYLSFNANNF